MLPLKVNRKSICNYIPEKKENITMLFVFVLGTEVRLFCLIKSPVILSLFSTENQYNQISIIGTFDATFQFICRQWAFLSKQQLILIPVNKGDDRNTLLLLTSCICGAAGLVDYFVLSSPAELLDQFYRLKIGNKVQILPKGSIFSISLPFCWCNQ